MTKHPHFRGYIHDVGGPTANMYAIDCARNIDAVDPGDLVVITAGAPLDVSGSTNLLRVQSV